MLLHMHTAFKRHITGVHSFFFIIVKVELNILANDTTHDMTWSMQINGVHSISNVE